MNDIDVEERCKEDNPKLGWNPIGDEYRPFTGGLDGNNKAIKGLYINRPDYDRVALFGYIKGAKLKNICIVNGNVTGRNKVSALVAEADIYAEFSIENNFIIGGNYHGNDYVGSILGMMNSYRHDRLTMRVNNNFSSANLYSTGSCCGGICGYTFSSYYVDYLWQVIEVKNNHFDGSIHGKDYVGGIIGRHCWEYMGGIFCSHNLSTGVVHGYNHVNGIGEIPNIDGFRITKEDHYSLSSNVCCCDTLSAVNEIPYRISALGSSETSTNYALFSMIIMKNGRHVEVEDEFDKQGISYSQRTLQRKTTYSSMGFDFFNYWQIIEGEKYPYNIHQADTATITKFGDGIIEGLAHGSGVVYVFIGNEFYCSEVKDNQWDVSIGNVVNGTKAKVSVATNGKMPSFFVQAVSKNTDNLIETISNRLNIKSNRNELIVNGVIPNDIVTICYINGMIINAVRCTQSITKIALPKQESTIVVSVQRDGRTILRKKILKLYK
jgi:hypothetical protein